MCRNEVMDALARRKVTVASASFPDTVLKDVASESIIEKIDSQNLMVMIDLAVSVMPEQRRSVFTLSRKYNMSHKEIAEKLGISVKTVEYHISKALSSLRDMMKILLFFI
jgi:RNA polymerase sigma-70 factor (ECF subfamily)